MRLRDVNDLFRLRAIIDRLVFSLAHTLSEMGRLLHFGLPMRDRTAVMSEEPRALIAPLRRRHANSIDREPAQEA